MNLKRKNILFKLKAKNKGNVKLLKTIDILINTIENANWKTKNDVLAERVDADCVHSNGFYFFDINIHRTMILILFEENEATVIWAGSHDEYNILFKGNKRTIENWLRNKGLII